MGYYENKLLRQLETKIISCREIIEYKNISKIEGSEKVEIDNKNLKKKFINESSSRYFELEFEDTLFFPGGGGQAADRGKVFVGEDELELVDIIEKDKKIIHVVSFDSYKNKVELYKDMCVKLVLDWACRIDGMQQHTGQHLLSGCFNTLYSRNTKGLHIGKDVSQLDIEGEFTEDMVQRVEDYANELISRSINIKNYVLKDGCEVHTRRPLPKTATEIRILEIEGIDINACCGIHLDNTIDLGIIKIKKYYKHKGGTRFEYLVGKRASEYLLKRDRVFDQVLNKYSSGADNIIQSLENIEKKKDDYYSRMNYMTNLMVDYDKKTALDTCAKNARGLKIIKRIYEDEESWYIDKLQKDLIESGEIMTIFANRKDDKYLINMMVSKDTSKKHIYIDLGKDFKVLTKNYGAKGGGSKFSASGIVQNQKNIDIILDSVYSIYVGVL